MEYFSLVFWIIILWMFFSPMVKKMTLERQRLYALRRLEIKRHSRVIALIHRQESISIFGIPLSRYINIEDSEQIMRAIRMTPDEMPIDLIIHTPGGLVLAADQIAHALESHQAKVTVFVPHYAMSGGTMIALAADEIIMDPNAVLGPVDPQVNGFPAVSLLKVLQEKDINKIDDETLILADVAEKAITQVKNKIYYLLENKLGEEKAKEISEILTSGRWTHDYPIGCLQMVFLGIKGSCEKMPEEIYKLMDLFPQPVRQQPAVNYIPIPYKKEDV